MSEREPVLAPVVAGKPRSRRGAGEGTPTPRLAVAERVGAPELREHAIDDVDVIELAEGQDLTEVAREASTRATIVTAAGGDGTVNSVAAGVVGTASEP